MKIKTKETKLRIIEKVFDKRIQAHENIMYLIKNIRSVNATWEVDEQSNLISYPSSMSSNENFTKFINDTFFIIHENTHWLNTSLIRELGFLQDYFSSLKKILKDVNDNLLPEIGIIVEQDFIDLASNLENITFEFFRKDIYSMEINKHNEWHKYPKEITFERINKTNLYSRRNEIEILIKTK